MRSSINPESLYWASFNRFELRIPGRCVIECSGPGAADAAVAYWTPKVFEQVAADDFPRSPDAESIRQELSEYGAWDNDEVCDNPQNMLRLVWLAACDISEQSEPDCSEPLPSVVSGGAQ